MTTHDIAAQYSYLNLVIKSDFNYRIKSTKCSMTHFLPRTIVQIL